MLENIELLRKAVEVEIKYSYIDIQGKKSTFSKFVKSELLKEYKKTKAQKWQVLIEAMERYSVENLPARRKILNRLCKVIKDDINPKPENAEIKNIKLANECDVTYIKGVGPKVGYLLNKLNIFTAEDLLYFFPKNHIDYSSRTFIKDIKEGETTTIFGYIKSSSAFVSKSNLGIIKVTVADESGNIELDFFQAKANRYVLERTKAQFPLNAKIMVSGTVKFNKFNMHLTVDKPTYSILNDDTQESTNLNIGRIVPVYPLVENLSIKTLRRAVFNALEMYKQSIKTVVPDYIRNKYNIMEKFDAIRQMHFPSSMDMLHQARFSLAFEEFFISQLRLAKLKELNKQINNSVHFTVKPDGLVMNFIKSLPFKLTHAQMNAVNEILNDMQSQEPMHRLLQGDVGSGKTVVAAIMLLSAVENGYQGAIMAPTEILAQQHYNTLVNMLAPLGISIGLFIGSLNKKEKRLQETNLFNGQTKIAVGTHALIQENVQFNNLGAVVVDEQHRFGVKQRSILSKKGEAPQILTMTATPIPRTLALSIHGDMDLTIIDELPKGRKPILTSISNSKKQIYSLIKEEIKKGHQAYIVYPLIDESEALSAKAATTEYENLKTNVFPELKIGLLHGKLKNAEKESVMNDFKNGKFDILVSTTVVEVGVDVPNATVMVIENAERFGLSQLHQLRGRVGRSDVQSYCVLSSSSRSDDAKARLGIMAETNDGFVIAERDLALRGPGEFLGVRQSGLPDMIVADIVKDTKIFEEARYEAIEFVKNNKFEQYPELKTVENLRKNNFEMLAD